MTSSHLRLAVTDHPVHELIRARYSPYCFNGEPVEREKILACLEAARWAASSFNEQPWTFLVGLRGDGEAFGRLLDCLYEPNQAWAGQAGAVMVTVLGRNFAGNGKSNRMAQHDVGLAVGNLTTQATALGLSVHEMAGIDLAKTRAVCEIPDTHDPCTALAIGYAANPEGRNDAMAERDRGLRQRKPMSGWVFTDQWGSAWAEK